MWKECCQLHATSHRGNFICMHRQGLLPSNYLCMFSWCNFVLFICYLIFFPWKKAQLQVQVTVFYLIRVFSKCLTHVQSQYRVATAVNMDNSLEKCDWWISSVADCTVFGDKHSSVTDLVTDDCGRFVKKALLVSCISTQFFKSSQSFLWHVVRFQQW